MKILVVGDLHFRGTLPYGSAFSDGRRPEWEAVKDAIHKAAEDCDEIVLLGDNLHNRNNPSVVLHEFIRFLNGFHGKNIHILLGNHEKSGKNSAIDFLKATHKDNWFVYTDIHFDISFADKKATFIPYVTPADLFVETIEEGSKQILDKLPANDICFVHLAITGTANTDYFNEIMLEKDKLQALYTMTIGGHIHKSEFLSPTVLVAGSVFTSEVGETNKTVWIYDTETERGTPPEAVMLPVRGIYKVEVTDSNLYTAFRSIPPYSIVKCYITDRRVNVDVIKTILEKYDATVLIEQYPRERAKVHFTEGSLDLSVENMLKVYAEVRKIDHHDLLSGFDMVK